MSSNISQKRHELNRSQVGQYIFGSFDARGDGAKDRYVRLRRSLCWYKQLESRVATAPLFSIVHDVGFLLLDAEQFSFRTLFSYEELDQEIREVRFTYENSFLNSLLRDPAFERASRAVRRDKRRDDLIIRTLQCILHPLLNPRKLAFTTPLLNPQFVREVSVYSSLSPEKEAQKFELTLKQPRFFCAALQASVKALLKADDSISVEDLSEIEHWDAYLGREDLRKIGRRIAYNASIIRPADKRRFPMREEEPEVNTELGAIGSYPQGGFSELSTRGRPENLVASELIYLGEGNLTGTSDEEIRRAAEKLGTAGTPTIIDMFAYRFMANELLYYRRESGQLKRVRRTVHFVIEPDPPQANNTDYHSLRWRDPHMFRVRDRLIVIVLGLAVRLAQDLATIFSKDSVKFEIHILASNPVARNAAERDVEILKVLLEHQIRKERVEVFVENCFDMRECDSKSRRIYGLSVQYKNQCRPGLPGNGAIPKNIHATVLKLGGSDPLESSGHSDASYAYMPLDNDFLDRIQDARDQLLGEITGSRVRRFNR